MNSVSHLAGEPTLAIVLTVVAGSGLAIIMTTALIGWIFTGSFFYRSKHRHAADSD